MKTDPQKQDRAQMKTCFIMASHCRPHRPGNVWMSGGAQVSSGSTKCPVP
uniref:Uncharacterized protein n=2 Tax=Anguilla anguilla TaxID=7936 RepID=A0A0E9R841_ANGAN